MPKYILGFHGQAMTATQQSDAATMAKWATWYKNMGSAVADLGQPAGPSKTIAPGGRVNDTNGLALTGYSILEAPSMDDAISLAKGCPIYEAGGSVEIAELVPVM